MSQHILLEFCIRLAAGLACMMVFTLGRGVGGELYRTLMLVVLGLSVLGWLNVPEGMRVPAIFQAVSASLSFAGFIGWTLGRVRPGAAISVLLSCSTAGSLIAWTLRDGADWQSSSGQLWTLGIAASSALLLGAMLAAMLLGHTYLIAPTMSIDPLRLLVGWIVAGLSARSALTLVGLANSGLSAGGSDPSGEPFWWWMFGARVVIGLIAPAVMAWMVWQTARIRATQSATGILYAGVVLVFFGELLGQLLRV